jgi:hypothetical protein
LFTCGSCDDDGECLGHVRHRSASGGPCSTRRTCSSYTPLGDELSPIGEELDSNATISSIDVSP